MMVIALLSLGALTPYGRAVPALPAAILPISRSRLLTASGSSDATRTLLALQSGISLRDRRRLELALLANETLPEERAGVLFALATTIVTSTAALTAERLPPPWDAPLFGLLTIAVSMLLQVALSPTCLDGQGSFGRLLRAVGWRSHGLARRVAACATALLARPSAVRARTALTTQLAKVATVTRRSSALVMAARLPIAAWAEQVGLTAALVRLHERWRQTPIAAELWRVKAHLEWNWKRFLEENESQQRQESMATALMRAVERRKRAEGENR